MRLLRTDVRNCACARVVKIVGARLYNETTTSCHTSGEGFAAVFSEMS